MLMGWFGGVSVKGRAVIYCATGSAPPFPRNGNAGRRNSRRAGGFMAIGVVETVRVSLMLAGDL